MALGVASAAGVVGLGAYGAYLVDQGKASSVRLGGGGDLWSPEVQQRIAATMKAFGFTVLATGATALLAWRSGIVPRLLATSPFLSGGIFLLGTIGSMMLVRSTDVENSMMKLSALAAFGLFNGLSISMLGFFGPALISQAAMYTGITLGGLSIVAANSPSSAFLWMGGPLSVGLGLVFVSSLGAAFFPATAVGGFASALSLYGGLGLFSMFVLYDTSRIIHHAKTLPADTATAKAISASTGAHVRPFDPYWECLSIYLDAMNLFVRFVQVLATGKSKR